MFSSIVTADLHFEEKKVKERLHEKLGAFLEEQRVLHKAQVLFILGDFFDAHLDPQRRIQFQVLDAIADFFHMMQFDKIFILKGNHDESFIGFHNLKILTLDPRVVIIETPTLINVNNVDIPKIYAIPFCKSHDLFYSIIKELPEDAVLLIHQSVNGFKLNSKFVCTKGVDIQKPFSLVLSGDLHDFQKKGNIVYLGSPYQTRRDESHEKFMISMTSQNVSVIQIPSSISQRFLYVERLDQVEEIGDLKGKTIVLTGTVVDEKYLADLREKGIKVITTQAVMKDTAPTIEVDMSSFSSGLLRSIVNGLSDPYMKVIGEDLLEKIGSSL